MASFSEPGSKYSGLLKCLALLWTLIAASACVPSKRLPVMGTVSQGVYFQSQGNFSCPLLAPSLGLNGTPVITDAVRVTRTEQIPLSQREPGDWKSNRLVSDMTVPAREVRIEDASGTLIEIGSGRLSGPVEAALQAGLSRGGWHFTTRDRTTSAGTMKTAFSLVPWFEEGQSYMGVDLAASYRQGQGPDAQLWISSNLVVGQALHVIIVKLPAAVHLSDGVEPRDLAGIRDDIIRRPALQDRLLEATYAWLQDCSFSSVVQ